MSRDLCTVITASNSPYQFWQLELAYHSFCQVRQGGDFLVLLAKDEAEELCRPLGVPYRCFAPCSPHPKTGDVYAPYNKPGLLRQWLQEMVPYRHLHLIDPDCVFSRPIKESVAVVGQPHADSIWFMDPTHVKGHFILDRHCRTRIQHAQPLAVPLLIATEDLRLIVDRWYTATEDIRQDKVCGEKWPWVEEMWAYVVASAEAGLNHRIGKRQSLTDDDDVQPIIHYSYPIKNGDWRWSKRDYRPWEIINAPESVSNSAKVLFRLLAEYRQMQNKV